MSSRIPDPAEPVQRRIMSSDEVRRALVRIGHEIVERGHGTANLALVGIRSRGVDIAQRLRRILHDIEGGEAVPFGVVDITLYRDDLDRRMQNPVVQGTSIDFSVDGRRILLVDDVLFTGRTIRAAMDALMDLGRPRVIRLAVLVDRGHRELPIRPDYVGKNLPTSRKETVAVMLTEHDGQDRVVIQEPEEGEPSLDGAATPPARRTIKKGRA